MTGDLALAALAWATIAIGIAGVPGAFILAALWGAIRRSRKERT